MLPEKEVLITLTTGIVSAYVSNNPVPVGDLPALIKDIHNTVTGLGAAADGVVENLTPAVNPKKSITDDYIVCLDDGKKFKSLKRHLSTLGMTPEDYRTKWGLPADYPMVAPNYAAARSNLAKKMGLGTKANRGR